MITYTLKKGDLLRNKVTGDIAILRANPYTRFYPDEYHGIGGVESGTAETCYPLTFTVIQGENHIVRRSPSGWPLSPVGTGIGVQINVRQGRFAIDWERV